MRYGWCDEVLGGWTTDDDWITTYGPEQPVPAEGGLWLGFHTLGHLPHCEAGPDRQLRSRRWISNFAYTGYSNTSTRGSHRQSIEIF